MFGFGYSTRAQSDSDHADSKRWIDELRKRTHDIANHSQSVQGEVAGLRITFDERMRRVDDQQADTKEQIGALTGKLEKLDEKIDTRFENVDTKLNSIAIKVAGITAVLTMLGSGIVQLATAGHL